MRYRGELPRTPLVDFNSAILSIFSDGSVNWPRTLRLAQSAFQDGVTRAVVTASPCCREVLRRRAPQFSALLHQRGIPIEIATAIELSFQSDLFEQAKQFALTPGGRSMPLVYLRVPVDTRLPIAPVVRRLSEMNRMVVLLAPERCRRLRENRAELMEVVACGGKLQLSAASLLDQTDRGRIRFCQRLIRRGLCHFVASESGRHHDLPISLREAYNRIVGWAGQKVADMLCCENAACLFEGESARQSVGGRTSRAA